MTSEALGTLFDGDHGHVMNELVPKTEIALEKRN